MNEPHDGGSKGGGQPNLASCIVATVFLLFIVAGVIVVYFFVFKPRDPEISVDAVQFPAFSLSSNSNSTAAVTFTFLQFISVRNPNRDAFTHYDSTLQLAYAGNPLGFVFIPAGRIDGGHTQHMSAKFSVQSVPIPPPPFPVALGPTMEIQTTMKLAGRVRVLKIFTHRVQSGVTCGAAIEVSTGSVLGFHC